MTPIVTENKTLPDEVVAIGSAVAFLRHDKAGDRLWLSRDGVNLIAVPTLQPDAPIDSFVAVPGRDALLIAQGETLAVASLCPDQPDPPESAPKGLPALDQRPE